MTPAQVEAATLSSIADENAWYAPYWSTVTQANLHRSYVGYNWSNGGTSGTSFMRISWPHGPSGGGFNVKRMLERNSSLSSFNEELWTVLEAVKDIKEYNPSNPSSTASLIPSGYWSGLGKIPRGMMIGFNTISHEQDKEFNDLGLGEWIQEKAIENEISFASGWNLYPVEDNFCNPLSGIDLSSVVSEYMMYNYPEPSPASTQIEHLCYLGGDLANDMNYVFPVMGKFIEDNITNSYLEPPSGWSDEVLDL